MMLTVHSEEMEISWRYKQVTMKPLAIFFSSHSRVPATILGLLKFGVSHSPLKRNCCFLKSSNQPQYLEDSGIYQGIWDRFSNIFIYLSWHIVFHWHCRKMNWYVLFKIDIFSLSWFYDNFHLCFHLSVIECVWFWTAFEKWLVIKTFG